MKFTVFLLVILLQSFSIADTGKEQINPVAQDKPTKERDYISKELFFIEALLSFSKEVDLASFSVKKVQSSQPTLQQENFAAKVSYVNTLGTPFETYQVDFGFKENDMTMSCLGSILEIDHQAMKAGEGLEYKSRSGLVYLSECQASQNNIVSNMEPNFAIEHNVVFPKVKTLPLGAQNIYSRYFMTKKVDTSKKLLHCQSADTNSFDVPRFAMAFYDMGEYMQISMESGRSTIETSENDFPVDVGPQDKGSLPWVRDNIAFFESLGAYGAQVALFVKKSDCMMLGEEDKLTFMSCPIKIPQKNRVNEIQEILFQFATEIVSQPIMMQSGDVVTYSTARFKAKVEFELDRPNKYHDHLKTTKYHNTIRFENSPGGATECLFGKDIPQPEKKLAKMVKPDKAV